MCETDAGLTFIRHFASLSSDFVPLLICARSFAFSLRRLAGLDHVALRPQKRGCLLGTGGGGQRAREWRLDHGYRPKKTGETVDRRQNNGSVKAVSPRHCAATSALRNCCFNCRAWAESQGQCLLRNNPNRKKSNFRSPAPPPGS